METLWDVELALDREGALARVAAVLAGVAVNIHSVCMPDPSTCHLLVDDGPAAAAVLAAAGVTARTREVVVCGLQNRPGTLAAVSAALEAAGARVDLLYQATDKGLVIGAADLDAVRTALVGCGRLASDTAATSAQ